MEVPAVMMVVMVAVTAIGTAFRLERDLHLYKIRPEAMEHILDHMVGPNAKSLVSNFSRQMPISQVPSKAHKLVGISMPDFDNKLRSGLNLQPPPIFKLQAISIGHRNRLRKVEEDIFALICSQANAASMTRFKIKCENPCRLFLRPQPSAAMNGSTMHRHIST
jgi:hypothetical protein